MIILYACIDERKYTYLLDNYLDICSKDLKVKFYNSEDCKMHNCLCREELFYDPDWITIMLLMSSR